MGVFVKDKFKGKNIDEWQKACTKYNKNYEEVDISAAISACLAEKDEEEVVMFHWRDIVRTWKLMYLDRETLKLQPSLVRI